MTSSPTAKRRRRSLLLSRADVDSILLSAVFVAVILVVAAVGYLVYAVIARPIAPRTEIERRVYYYEQGVSAEPTNTVLWTSYASALIDAGQYNRADGVIRDALRAAKDKAGLLVQRARLEHLRGQDDRALKTADDAIDAVDETRKAYSEKAVKQGIGAPFARSDDIINANILKAEIYEDRGQTQRAIDAYTAALKEEPLMADVLAARGDLHLKLGDQSAARKDYRAALRYDPENDVATQGLEKLGDTD